MKLKRQKAAMVHSEADEAGVTAVTVSVLLPQLSAADQLQVC